MTRKCGCGAQFDTVAEKEKHQTRFSHTDEPRRPPLQGNKERHKVPPMAGEPA